MSQLECRPLGLQVTRWWCARMNRRHGHIVAQCDIGPDEALHSELKVAAPASSTAGLPDRVSILGTTSTHTHTRGPHTRYFLGRVDRSQATSPIYLPSWYRSIPPPAWLHHRPESNHCTNKSEENQAAQ